MMTIFDFEGCFARRLVFDNPGENLLYTQIQGNIHHNVLPKSKISEKESPRILETKQNQATYNHYRIRPAFDCHSRRPKELKNLFSGSMKYLDTFKLTPNPTQLPGTYVP